MATPLQTVKSQFESKQGLVSKLLPLLDRPEGEDDKNFEQRLLRVSNQKLLTLWKRAQTTKETFGSKDALIAKVSELKGSGANKIAAMSTGRLLSMHKSLSRKA